MASKTNKIFAAVFFVLALILTLTPSLIAPVCNPVVDKASILKCESDMKMSEGSNMSSSKNMKKEPMKLRYMKCKWFGEAVKATGIIMTALAVALFTLSSSDIRKGIVVANILLGLQAIIHIIFIGGCMKPTMPCRAHTIPVVILISGIYIVLSFYYLVKAKKEDAVNKDS